MCVSLLKNKKSRKEEKVGKRRYSIYMSGDPKEAGRWSRWTASLVSTVS
jgi:hypothetical protein